LTLQSKREEEAKRRKELLKQVDKQREAQQTIDQKKIFKLKVTFFLKEEEETRQLDSFSNELFFDFKKRLFEFVNEDGFKYNIFLANKNITNFDAKSMSEIFLYDKNPIIEVREKIYMNGPSQAKQLTKVAVENYPTVNEIFFFLYAYLDKHKYPRNYSEEINNGVIVISFENPEVAYGFIKALNIEKYSNNLYSRLKTSLYTDSQLKHPGHNYLENIGKLYSAPDRYNTDHHSKKLNPLKGTYKNNMNRSLLDKRSMYINEPYTTEREIERSRVKKNDLKCFDKKGMLVSKILQGSNTRRSLNPGTGSLNDSVKYHPDFHNFRGDNSKFKWISQRNFV